MRAPFQHAAADQSAALFEVETVEELRVVRPPGRRAEIHVPIDDFLVRLRLGRQPAAHERGHSHRVGVDGVQLAELAGARQLAREREVRQISPLRAGLEDAPRAAHRVGQRQALRDVLRARLLAIHVLAGAGGIHGGRRMPVRARGDQHGIDIVAVQEFAKVAILRAVLVAVLLVGDFLDRIAARRLHVAHGDELDVVLLQEAAEVVRPPVSDADAAQRDSFVGRNPFAAPLRQCSERQLSEPGGD